MVLETEEPIMEYLSRLAKSPKHLQQVPGVTQCHKLGRSKASEVATS